MTTVIIDTRTAEAKMMVEYLKTTHYARVMNEYLPNDETLSAIKEVEEKKVKSYVSAKEMMSELKKKARV